MAEVLPRINAQVRRGTIVRAMSPVGVYWSQSALHEDASYVVRNDLIFIACHFDQDSHEGDYYSEYDEPTPEEIRLLASLALPIGIGRGSLVLYPSATRIRLDERRRLDDPEVIAQVEKLLRCAIALDVERATGEAPIPMPPAEYRHFHWPLPVSMHEDILRNIDSTDHLMTRGLSTWMKGSMINMHRTFGEEAHYPLWISLDASFAIVQGIIRATGIANPSAADCQRFVHEAFGEEDSGLKYFEEFYEDRIMTMHPENRFGTFAFAPIMHSDFYALHRALREVYRYVLIGEVVDPQEAFDKT
ncbi:hypothetical protein U1707_07855 [Sphingomonas sp. PB2P12]|uniref:hypothetical protein n=1 Tax=Sphingomonas sandaracina TaxID=3096157 RepID=UPI002FCCB64C